MKSWISCRVERLSGSSWVLIYFQEQLLILFTQIGIQQSASFTVLVLPVSFFSCLAFLLVFPGVFLMDVLLSDQQKLFSPKYRTPMRLQFQVALSFLLRYTPVPPISQISPSCSPHPKPSNQSLMMKKSRFYHATSFIIRQHMYVCMYRKAYKKKLHIFKDFQAKREKHLTHPQTTKG